MPLVKIDRKISSLNILVIKSGVCISPYGTMRHYMMALWLVMQKAIGGYCYKNLYANLMCNLLKKETMDCKTKLIYLEIYRGILKSTVAF